MYLNITKRFVVVWSSILIVFTCMVVFVVFKTNEITYGKNILDDGVLNISSYYAEYEMTVVSNKNINTYFMKEWYKKGVGGRLEYLDYMGNTTRVISNKTSCYMSNSNNKAEMIVDNRGSENFLILATYSNIFNKNITCSCVRNIYEKDNETNVIYSVCNKENCMQSDGLKRMGITGFELNIKDNIPISYMVYMENKKEYACIVYNKFNVNTQILDEMFNT